MSDWSLLLNFLSSFANELDFIHPSSIFENLDIFFEKPKLRRLPRDYEFELINHYMTNLIQNSDCKEVIENEKTIIICYHDSSYRNGDNFNYWRSGFEPDPKVPQENLIIKSRRSGSNPDHNQK